MGAPTVVGDLLPADLTPPHPSFIPVALLSSRRLALSLRRRSDEEARRNTPSPGSSGSATVLFRPPLFSLRRSPPLSTTRLAGPIRATSADLRSASKGRQWGSYCGFFDLPCLIPSL